MKKIITFLLLFSMLASSFAVAASEQTAETKAFYDAEKLLFALDVLDKDNYNPQKTISRAEFAGIIAGILTDDVADESALDYAFDSDGDFSEEKIFDDVDSTLKEYEAINTVYQYGYMVGISDTCFGPNFDITKGAVIKVLVNMLGYSALAEVKGGYPAGYMEVAKTIKLTSDVTAVANDFITYGELSKILSNAMEIYILDEASLSNDSWTYEKNNETFMKRFLDLEKIEGKVTDNGLTTYYGKSAVGNDYAVIDDFKVKIGSCVSVRSMLGREVDAYYTIDNDVIGTLVYVSTIDTVHRFDSKDFYSYGQGRLKYTDSNGRVISVSVSANAAVVYNNKVLKQYTKDIFEFPYGDVTLISSKGGSSCDVIIIRDYLVGKVKKTEDTRLYTETIYKSMSGIKTLDFDADSVEEAFAYDANGNEIKVTDIKAGDVISVLKSKDGSCLEVVVSDRVPIEITASSSIKTNDTIELFTGTEVYTIKDESDLVTTLDIKNGSNYVLYFDFKGNLAYVSNGGTQDSYKKAFVTNVGKTNSSFDELYAIKLYTEDGVLLEFEIGQKIKFNGSSEDTKDVFSSLQNAIGELVLYDLDDSTGKIVTSITMPLEFGKPDNDHRGWYYLAPRTIITKPDEWTEDEWNTYKKDNETGYTINGNSFGNLFFYSSGNVKCFTIPTLASDYDNERMFSVQSMENKDRRLLMNAYASDKNALVPEAIAYSTGKVNASNLDLTTAFLIEKITKTVNSEGDNVTRLHGYRLTQETVGTANVLTLDYTEDTVFVDTDDSQESIPVTMDPANPGYDTKGRPASISLLEPGDIVRYNINALNELNSIGICYDYSENKGYPMGGISGARYWGGLYEGYALFTNDGMMRMSTVLPHTLTETELSDPAYMKNIANMVTCRVEGRAVFVVEESPRGVSIRKGTIDDIMTYDDTGALGEYDKIVVPAYLAITEGVVIYKK